MEKIAVLVPCYNEELTVEKVVSDFKKELPDADIYVYDNNSKDRTSELALKAGAIVRKETAQGKGNVVRSMFQDIDADIYVMVDGDDTYPADEVHGLIEAVRYRINNLYNIDEAIDYIENNQRAINKLLKSLPKVLEETKGLQDLMKKHG